MFFRKLLKRLALLLASSFLALLLLEGIYRYQWFDFYRVELEGLNKGVDLSGKRKKHILVGGDSFSAAPDNYVEAIRAKFPGYAVINSSLPGTGIVQASFVLPDRAEDFAPDVFIYQLYTGNDLLDISHPSGGDVGFLRKTYWWLSDRFRVLSFLNYRMGNVKYNYATDITDPKQSASIDTFSLAHYSSREKLQFKAEPALLENSLYLGNGRADDYSRLSEELKEIIAALPAGCKVYLLILPHAAQVSARHYREAQLAGGKFTRSLFEENSFPFYDSLRNDFPSAVILDPLPVFREKEAQGAALFYPNDPHLSRAGQQVLGEFVCQHLDIE